MRATSTAVAFLNRMHSIVPQLLVYMFALQQTEGEYDARQ